MRVLHVHSGNLYGGVETLLATLARYRDLCPLMELEFALCFEGRIASELREAGDQVHSLGKVRSRYPLTVMRARRRLRELLRARRFDAAICHMPWTQAIFGPIVRSAGVPLVFFMHGLARGRHWVERWAWLTPPDLVICNSDYTASTSGNLYAKTPREVLYLPVARAEAQVRAIERSALRTELDTPDDAVVILQASRMEAWKGHASHLEALGLLRDLPGWVCWIAGGAQSHDQARYLQSLRDLATGQGLSKRVRFLGQRSDVGRLMSAADIYCQPNTGADSFGIVLIEAMLAGLPVVTTALGGAMEIVDSSCGLIVAPGDVQALADALGKLIRNAAERQRLGIAGEATRRRALRTGRTTRPVVRDDRHPSRKGMSSGRSLRSWR
jgi:glycosyltransferase involved in cell wall biosynthesis